MLRFIIFLVINFGALALGSVLMGSTPAENRWYQSLQIAPWTPPGWFFGFAWTTIMICFSIFMWKASFWFSKSELSILYILFAIQFILNVIWNPIFFHWHKTGIALVTIVSLTLLIAWFTFKGIKNMGAWGILMLPYQIWLIVACTLNGYVYANN
ncbi:MAG: tryptophan-rich sensory protein [Bacteroidetes bacterium]|nr:tryptophan-rich sensory protein [Bacteroidota bacterium]